MIFVGIEATENQEINKKIVDLCRKNGKIVIGVSNCDFINKDDSNCVQILNFYKNSNDIKNGIDKYLHTTEELLKKFNYIENAEELVIDNPNKIAENINNINILEVKSHYPIIKDSDKIITKKCYEKAYEIYGKDLPNNVKERLDLELNSIIKNNFEAIYLINSDLVKKSNELGYEVGSRGCVGNSFVAYLLKITNYNPIDYNLPFEIFAGINYDKEPYIDLNFSRKIKHKIFEYLQEKFGKDKIIWAGTIETLTDRTAEDTIKDFCQTFEINQDKLYKNKDKFINNISGIKICTGEHPEAVFIIPKDLDINDFSPTEADLQGDKKTHFDYHSLWMSGYRLYKFDILEHDDSTMLNELQKITNINSNTIDLNDKETLDLFLHANEKSLNNSTKGISEFGSEFACNILEIVKPRNFNDLVCISALSHGTNTWKYNAESLIKNEGIKVDKVISNRADVFNFLLEKGIDKETAFQITEFIRKGKLTRGRSQWQNISDKYKKVNEQWAKYRKIMEEHNIPEWYINSAEKIRYLFPKSHAIGYTMNAFKIAWYKVHYPDAFYKAYFKIKSDLNIKKYYCKRQVLTELTRLYDKKEIQENNKDFIYNTDKNCKIEDLEILLEMYNRGIAQDKEEIIKEE